MFGAALGVGNVDLIFDFSSVDTFLLVSDALGPFSGLADSGVLDATQFDTSSIGQDAFTRIIFDQSSGALYYDVDGTGAATAVQFATVFGDRNSVSYDDFRLGAPPGP